MSSMQVAPAPSQPQTASYPPDVVAAAVRESCARIAPLWPLKHFVAVNPFLGLSGRSFQAACAALRRVAGVEMLMPRAFYRAAVERGAIRDDDLESAREAAPAAWMPPPTLIELKAALARKPAAKPRPAAHVPTVAEVLDTLADGDAIASRTAFMIDEISRWCAAYFDEGQSVWRLPGRGLPLYGAWRSAMRYDRNAEVMGIAGFRRLVGDLPDDPLEAIAEIVRRQGVPERALADYLHQALLSIAGWAAHARYLQWQAQLEGRDDDSIVHLLAVRLSFGYALFAQRTDDAFGSAWREAMQLAALAPLDERLGEDEELCVDLIAHEAYEAAYRRRLFAQLHDTPRRAPGSERATVQAAFCIDVRSEVYRRALEAELPGVQTLGFAGFFGFPIEYVPLGLTHGGAQCPVLLRPAFTVRQTVRGASAGEERRVLAMRLLRRRAAKAWKSFKSAAVSSFIFVETAGLGFAPKLAADALRLTRPVRDPDTDGFDEAVIGRLGPTIVPETVDGRRTGFDDRERVDMAEAVLRGMSLLDGFAPIVLLVGHGSTTVNNPYASSLDCGACGGYTGEANARVAAAILNDPGVRSGLRERGIDIPSDTRFFGCLHDTTTDDVAVYDADAPAAERDGVSAVRAALERASMRARRERAPRLALAADARADRRVRARSRDWSHVRPEWGLAGNAAFIAAPRTRTRDVDLEGRVFLHDYDWRRDDEFRVLELILSAPMVVGSWINLQYYGSTVNNRVFGSGNKTLHNVAGILGVLEGAAGDLKIGLPWQSVHDGERFVHEPLRLTVIIEAPRDAMNAAIVKHAAVRDLVENGWLHLFAMDAGGRVSHRYYGNGAWEPLPEGTATT